MASKALKVTNPSGHHDFQVALISLCIVLFLGLNCTLLFFSCKMCVEYDIKTLGKYIDLMYYRASHSFWPVDWSN